MTRTDVAAQTPLRMTYEEFLSWADEDVHAEWVNGEVIVQTAHPTSHQRVFGFLLALIGLFVRLFTLGRLLMAPFEMRALADGPAREPDLLFIAREHLDRLTEERLEGPADLIIEVISDDSVARDRADKFYEYQDAGVREYWIVDPRPKHQRADFYVLDAHGQYQPIPVSADRVYHSTVLPGFWLRVEWLVAEETPEPLRVLAEIVGREKIIAALGDETQAI